MDRQQFLDGLRARLGAGAPPANLPHPIEPASGVPAIGHLRLQEPAVEVFAEEAAAHAWTVRRVADRAGLSALAAEVCRAEAVRSAVLTDEPEVEGMRGWLEEMGVEVRLNSLAVDMDDESVTIKGPDGLETIRCRTRIWAAGVQASPLAKLLAEKTGAETDRPGRVVVGPDCSLPGHPEVFAIGDMANVGGLPGVAQPAIQEGKYVGKLIRSRLAGGSGEVRPFKYFDKGSMATIGRRAAVLQGMGMKMKGWFAWMAWLLIHILFLIGFRNRLVVLMQWAWSYVTWQRGARLITGERKAPLA
jgi:hypothetical protein